MLASWSVFLIIIWNLMIIVYLTVVGLACTQIEYNHDISFTFLVIFFLLTGAFNSYHWHITRQSFMSSYRALWASLCEKLASFFRLALFKINIYLFGLQAIHLQDTYNQSKHWFTVTPQLELEWLFWLIRPWANSTQGLQTATLNTQAHSDSYFALNLVKICILSS